MSTELERNHSFIHLFLSIVDAKEGEKKVMVTKKFALENQINQEKLEREKGGLLLAVPSNIGACGVHQNNLKDARTTTQQPIVLRFLTFLIFEWAIKEFREVIFCYLFNSFHSF